MYKKQALLELLKHPHAKEAQRESMAVSLAASERNIYDTRTKITDFIAKVAPMLGLMGTLIPLGPGIVSIGTGDTSLLSESLLVAFDTTILGLIVGALALFVSAVRKSWYAKYMAAFEAAMECVLERANELAAAPQRDGYQAAAPQRASYQATAPQRASAKARFRRGWKDAMTMWTFRAVRSRKDKHDETQILAFARGQSSCRRGR